MTASTDTVCAPAGLAVAAFTPAQRSGRPRKLSAQQDGQVRRLMNAKRPDHYGFGSSLWTRQTVQQLLLARFQVSLSLLSVSKLLLRLGLVMPHQPLRGAVLAELTRHTCADVLFLRTDQPLATCAPTLTNTNDAIYGLYASNLLGAFWYASCPGLIDSANLVGLLKRLLRGRLRPVMLVFVGCPAEWTAAAAAHAATTHGRLTVALTRPADTQTKE